VFNNSEVKELVLTCLAVIELLLCGASANRDRFVQLNGVYSPYERTHAVW